MASKCPECGSRVMVHHFPDGEWIVYCERTFTSWEPSQTKAGAMANYRDGKLYDRQKEATDGE
jgi:DNA-directed RNA polymerase subunit RPC12/RpoP